MDADILEFQGEHRWLSNFWPATVVLDGEVFPSVENAYQAAKTYPQYRGLFRCCTPGEAKRRGREAEIRPTWAQEKVQVMRLLIEQKFAPGTELGGKLKATGDRQLIEGNRWGDTFWGVCRGRGDNLLGRILMDQRARL